MRVNRIPTPLRIYPKLTSYSPRRRTAIRYFDQLKNDVLAVSTIVAGDNIDLDSIEIGDSHDRGSTSVRRANHGKRLF